MGFRVQKTACASCIYRPDSPLDLKQLENAALRRDTYRVCHHANANDNNVCCAGYWAKHKNNFNLGRIAQRLQAVEFVTVDTLKEESHGN
jgi:hypothetical protein